MKRNSIRKASNFKLQAERSRFNTFLANIDNNIVACKYPDILEVILNLF